MTRRDDPGTPENHQGRDRGASITAGGTVSKAGRAHPGARAVGWVTVLGLALGPSLAIGAGAQANTPSDRTGRFIAKVLGATEDVWSQLLPEQANRDYRSPKLVIFSGSTRSACGTARSVMGPFYCLLDETVYLDPSFFEDMDRRLGRTDDFAHAYVIAYQVGFHVQNLLGLLPRVQQDRRNASRPDADQLSLRMALMADCLAGVWAHKVSQRYQLQVGDDDIGRAVAATTDAGRHAEAPAESTVVPSSFSRGSLEQRMHWARTGLNLGQVKACNTFETGRP